VGTISSVLLGSLYSLAPFANLMYVGIMQKDNSKLQRNNSLFDKWSIVHLLTGIMLGWIMDPFYALLIMTLWEPLEIFVLSPILSRFGINFGYESAKNSMSDMIFNVGGLLIAIYGLTKLVTPPFHLF
jgi:hypothetical protein